MAALVPTGAPVAILMDHGLAEEIAEKLIEAGVGTVEKLGSMTPEELELISGIEPDIVEKILVAVNSYYGQFEQQNAAPEVPEATEVAVEEPAETAGEVAETEIETPMAMESAVNGAPPVETSAEPHEDYSAVKKEFDTIKDSGEVS